LLLAVGKALLNDGFRNIAAETVGHNVDTRVCLTQFSYLSSESLCNLL